MIAATIPPNVFPQQEGVANVAMLVLMAIGISLLAMFAFQSFFRTDTYKELERGPLVFDNYFLRELKEDHKIIMKKYISMIILSLVLLIGGIILANLMSGNRVDGALLLITAIAVYLLLYAGYMMIVNNVIVNSDIRGRKH